MTDLDHLVTGPAGAPEHGRRNERTVADETKFKEEMMRRMAQVQESDPEEQKKQKQQMEEEEDLSPPEPEPTPASHITPFQLHEQISPMELEEGGKISPLSSAQPAQASSQPAAASLEAQPPEEEDFGGEESAAVFNAPSSQAPIQQQSSVPTPSEQKLAPQPSPAPEPSQPPPLSQPESQTAPTSKATGEPAPLPPSDLPSQGVTAEALSDPKLRSKEETAALLQKMDKEKPISGQIKEEPEEEERAAATSAPTPGERDFSGEHEKKKKEQDETSHADELSLPPPPIQIQIETPIAPTPPPPYTSMSSQVFDLFERMVGVLMIMTDSRMTETVITLNTPHFASSVFYGAQITIQEYTSAPKIFNIQLSGNPESVALFQENADDLMAAFQHGNYNFRVNRLETSYQSDRPVLHRKEQSSGDSQDQQKSGS